MKFELYYPDGTLQLDLSDRIPKILGLGNPNKQQVGTLTDLRVNEDNVWFVPLGSAGLSVLYVPLIQFSGNTFSWSARTVSEAFDFIYGIY